MLTVHVDTLGGSTTSYECSAGDTALDLKVRVAADVGQPSAKVKLIGGAAVLKNDAPLADLAADGSVRLSLVEERARTAAGTLKCHSDSAPTWEAAVEGLLGKLAQAGVEQGQVLWMDAHNRGPADSSCVVCAHFSPDVPGRGPLRVGRESRAGSSWEQLYAWADEVAAGKEVISISGASSEEPAHQVAGADKLLYVFYYQGESSPTAPVEHVCSHADSWNGAATGVLAALVEAGVQRGQVLSIDAHNDGPDGDAVFTAHFCRGLQGCGRLALTFQCSANEDAEWASLESRVAEESTGRELVSTTGSSNCSGRVVMYAFWHVPDVDLECCTVEAAPGAWQAAAEALASKLSELSVRRSQIVSIDAQNKGFGHPSVLSAHYRRAEGAPAAPPLRLAWEFRSCGREGWPYLRGWADARADGKDAISITCASSTLAAGGREGKIMLLFHHDPAAEEAAGEAGPRLAAVQSVESAAGWWNGAADGIVAALSQARVQRGHIISISACNASPDAAAEFQAHFCYARDEGRPGRLAYKCFNHNAAWGALHELIDVLGAGKDVISITGSSNESGRCVLYIFYWEEA